jgi:hypothetical protein
VTRRSTETSLFADNANTTNNVRSRPAVNNNGRPASVTSNGPSSPIFSSAAEDRTTPSSVVAMVSIVLMVYEHHAHHTAAAGNGADLVAAVPSLSCAEV